MIGAKVNSTDTIPDGMVAVTVPASHYAVFIALELQQVFNTWQRIWNSPLERMYTSVFEVYIER